jgi:cytoskeleton protein RodZ
LRDRALASMVADRSAGDFGGKLREARERRSLTLRQIANSTKISIGMLEALERNEVSRLPGGLFSRAFVRSYAIEVGLDPKATIEEFVAHFPTDAAGASSSAPQAAEDNEDVESERQLATTVLRLVLVSVPIAALVIYFAASERTPLRPAPEPQATATAVPGSLPAPPPVAQLAAQAGNAASDAVAAPAGSSAGADSIAGTQPAPLEAAGAQTRAMPSVGNLLLVGLTATRPCWVSATVDGQKTIEQILQPDETRSVEVHRDIVLTLGDASAISLTLNGAGAKPLGKDGQVVTIRLDPTNFAGYLLNR